MKKLRLTVEALEVESFPTGRAEGWTGTVEGQELAPTPPFLTCGLLTKPTNCPCTPRY
ncbi:MAG TPA: hypothetical protein VLK84_19385 [Longimicrobium sp.]|nr:hypothetical protein [Longimicrobium sp.]